MSDYKSQIKYIPKMKHNNFNFDDDLNKESSNGYFFVFCVFLVRLHLNNMIIDYISGLFQ